jgi:effector-binding domain-containing protein
MTLTLPELVARESSPYVAVPAALTMDSIAAASSGGFRSVFERLAARGVEPVGPPFLRYLVIDMAGTLQVEFCAPTAALLEAGEDLRSGVLPAGTYGRVQYRGPYEHLYDVNAALIGWAKERGVRWDVAEEPDGDHFGCRLEIYVTDPTEVPDPADWVTEVAIRVAP